jgi:hypothetical protein
MVKGFNRPFKNDSRRAKLAGKKVVSADGPKSAPHLKGADKHMPPGLALPEKSKKKQRQLERYARICEREAAAAAAAEDAARAPAAPKDAAMK